MPNQLMTETLVITLISVGCSTLVAGVAALGTFWLGRRKANTDDLQLGLEALKAGLAAAGSMTAEINESLQMAKAEIVRIERQAYKVLSENNRFRVIHGAIPASSLESFEPLAPENWDKFAQRVSTQ
jgi:hypothetical protein